MGAAQKFEPHWQAEETLETGEPEVSPPTVPDEHALVAGGWWMFSLSLAFFFLPVLNGVIAGLIGGYRAGSARNALLAAVVPAMSTTFLLWIALELVPLPALGPSSLDDIAIAAIIAFSVAALFVAAAIGGSYAQRKSDRLSRA